MIDKCSNDEIRTRSCPNCTLCGDRGELLYQDLKDHLFGAPGKWNLKKCLNPVCGLIWLDPMPLEEDIAKAYVKYYTHNDNKQDRNTILTRLFRFVKESYWAQKYGYLNDSVRDWKKLLCNLIYLHPLKKAEVDIAVMYLPAQPGGCLLDLGCGSGEWLKRMQDMGWHVEGIDFDPFAVENAKQKGLPVHFGSLEAQNYPDNHFDAITMKHVIEHFHSPLQVLRECHRILKPGARLMVETPNSQSLGHWIFKQNWRGLEPPRHLQLMNMAALKKAVKDAGFEIVSIRTLITMSYILCQSYGLSKNAASRNGEMQLTLLESLIPKVLAIMELMFLWLNYNVGENIVLMAKKSNDC